MELTYTKVGDYLIPNLTADTGEDAGLAPMGRYGRLRERFLKEHYHGTYTSMLLTGRLEPHLYQIDRQAQMQVDQIVARMMKANGVDEAMKTRLHQCLDFLFCQFFVAVAARGKALVDCLQYIIHSGFPPVL